MPKKTSQTITRRTFSASLAAIPLAAGASLGATRPGMAQANYPTKPVTVVLPFGAGGMADVSSRLAAEKLSEKLGQRFVIENKPGAGGITAARAVLAAAADGYTLGLVTNGTSISAALFKALPFDPVKQFDTISMMGVFELVFLTAADSPYKTLQDFITAATAQPGKLNVGTVNVGSTQHLGAELFKSSAGLNFQIIPHRTTPEITVAMLRNDVQLVVEFPAAVRGIINDKKARALATSGTSRSQAMPDVPTVAEAGVPGYEVISWNGFFGPSGIPKEVIDTVNKAMREIMADEAVKKRYAALGIEAKASSPEELKARLAGDIKKWGDVIQRAGIPKQ
ncbi:MAG: tripartite tricarboxylate transporter substrate binding protein [Rhizobiales bacterium]|nr:tripartite tricarboxylate transporter substrate binding protein [Hyphomicrobiales bacterium]